MVIPFQFVSGSLALDLVNTEVVVRGKAGDLLGTPQDLQQWWQEVQPLHSLQKVAEVSPEQFDAELLAQVKEVRAALHGLANKVVKKENVSAAELTKLNQIFSTGNIVLTENAAGKLSKAYQLREPGQSVLLFQIALSALHLLTESELERLHKCANERCVLYFYDSTKSATRQWCSLGCMNRARSIENYRKRKASEVA